MKTLDINVQVSSLKAQMEVLEAKIKKLQKTKKTTKFADFYGALAKTAKSTEEEIQAVKYKLKENLL